MLDHVVDIGTIIRIDADPDARDRDGRSTVDFTRRQKGIDDLPCHLGEVITLHDVWHQHHEFIAPQSCHGIDCTQAILHASCSLLEQGISCCVAEGIVHFLEVVEIEIQDTDPPAVTVSVWIRAIGVRP